MSSFWVNLHLQLVWKNDLHSSSCSTYYPNSTISFFLTDFCFHHYTICSLTVPGDPSVHVPWFFWSSSDPASLRCHPDPAPPVSEAFCSLLLTSVVPLPHSHFMASLTCLILTWSWFWSLILALLILRQTLPLSDCSLLWLQLSTYKFPVETQSYCFNWDFLIELLIQFFKFSISKTKLLFAPNLYSSFCIFSSPLKHSYSPSCPS